MTNGVIPVYNITVMTGIHIRTGKGMTGMVSMTGMTDLSTLESHVRAGNGMTGMASMTD